MTQIDEIDALADDVATLEESLGSASQVTIAFSDRLKEAQSAMALTGQELGKIERGFSVGLKRAFDDVIFDGAKLSDALSSLALSMSKTVFNAAVTPVTDQFGKALASGANALFGGFQPFANGAPFVQGRVMPFAQGGVFSSPMAFSMRGGLGVMGEAGPEAIMPLTRGSDGKLGVRAQGGGRPVHVTMNIQTPDVQSFQRSQGQLAARMSRVLSQGQRNF